MFKFLRRDRAVDDDFVPPKRCNAVDDGFWCRCDKVAGHKYSHSAGGTGNGDDWTWND